MKQIIELIIKFFQLLFGKKSQVAEPNPIETPVEGSISNEEDTIVEETEEPVEEIEPEIEEATLGSGSTRKDIKILVDNGHGKNTSGKKSPFSCYGTEPALEFEEWKWNREIAAPIVERLKELGYDADLVVTEDTDISLAERVSRINKVCSKVGSANVLLLSIHANAAGNGKEWMNARGWSAFTTKGITKSDKFAECLYDAAEKYFKGQKIRTDRSDGDRDWESDFYIIKKSYCPAVLTENFFYDNVEDTKYILSEEGREAIITAHVEGIINYINTLK